MTPAEHQAIAAICLMAATADDVKSDPERDKLREIFATLGGDVPAAVYHRVLMKTTTIETEAATLTSPEPRLLAYEMAACVCDADGAPTPPERAFLDRLRVALGLGAEAAGRAESAAASVALVPLPATVAAPATDDTDAMILRYAILNGGLELLPQSLATLAIVPLQVKMVYEIGSRYGHALSRAHIGELLATVGLGLTSQVVEGYARRLLGGLLGKKRGKALRGIAGTAVGAAMSFASTWAIGTVANAYYGGGRQLDAAALKALFAAKVDEGKRLFERHRPDVEASARSTSAADLVALVRGGGPAAG